ncbi:MAG: hypothetical protein AAFY26_19435 [Cyanobacteria bacterium J06638_22]
MKLKPTMLWIRKRWRWIAIPAGSLLAAAVLWHSAPGPEHPLLYPTFADDSPNADVLANVPETIHNCLAMTSTQPFEVIAATEGDERFYLVAPASQPLTEVDQLIKVNESGCERLMDGRSTPQPLHTYTQSEAITQTLEAQRVETYARWTEGDLQAYLDSYLEQGDPSATWLSQSQITALEEAGFNLDPHSFIVLTPTTFSPQEADDCTDCLPTTEARTTIAEDRSNE